MSKKSVLHIVPWFPHPENTIEAIFIAKHIAALNDHFKNSVLHVQFGKEKKIEKGISYEGIELDRYMLRPIMDKWKIKEVLAYQCIRKYLKKKGTQFDTVNFYIAYPNAIFIHQLKKKFPSLRFTITEQWSAYHTEFNLPKESRGRRRIANIFKAGVDLFTVSNALGRDIRNFSELPELPYRVIPNIVEDDFQYQEKTPTDTFVFSSINNWSALKNPIVLIEAFAIVQKHYPHSELILGGYGLLSKEMEEKVKTLQLQEKITLTGRLSKEAVLDVLQRSAIYCQSSNYETFSAICIEALATGTPVIATNIGGMPDFITNQNGFLVNEMTANAWSKKMIESIENYTQFKKDEISNQIISTYNKKRIGELFASYFYPSDEE